MTDLEAGFGDAPIEAATTFRAVLAALAEPGRIMPLEPRLAPPAPLAPTTAALALTLLDHDTPVHLDAALAVPDVLAWLRFHTGAPVVEDIGRAAFAVIGEPAGFSGLGRLAVGTAEYPDRSATLVLQVAALRADRGAGLTGPGIADRRRLALAPEPPGFWPSLQANHALYPLGFDTLLCAPGAICGLPRSTRISLEGGA